MPKLLPTTLLDALPSSVQQSLRGKKFTLKYPAGTQILRQDDPSKDVFVINYGRVLVTFYTERGTKLSFTEMQAGQSFGELSAIDLEPRSANILALDETSLTRIEHHQFQALLKSHPEFTTFVMRQMSSMIRRLNSRMQDLSTLDSTHRIYAELLRIAKNGQIRNDQIIVNNPPTHVEIACRIHSHREAVSRTYSALIKDGLLEKHSKQLVLKQPEVLRQRVEAHRNRK